MTARTAENAHFADRNILQLLVITFRFSERLRLFVQPDHRVVHRKNSRGRAVSYRRPATDSGSLLCLLPPLSSATAEALYNVYTHTHTDTDLAMDKVWLLGTLDGGNTQKRKSDVTDFAFSVSRDAYCGCVVKHMVPWGNRLRASLPTNWFTLAKRAITTSLAWRAIRPFQQKPTGGHYEKAIHATEIDGKQ